MEQHDAAWHAWRQAGITQRVLVHIDAHHDMWWVDDPDDITIANFISPAIATGMVREVYWVVPDPAWSAWGAHRAIRRVLRRIGRGYPEAGPVRVGHDAMTIRLMQRDVVVCPLRSLPRLDEPVLLDIDADYLLIPRLTTARRDRHTPVPWCWPDQLMLRLASAGVRTDLATIALSVDGGYTPLRWKYLGEELRQRLANPAGSTAAWDLMKRGAMAQHAGDASAADAAYADAATRLPNSAAPVFARALLAAAGNLDAAAGHYREALARDPTYRTPYASAGFPALWDGDRAEATSAFRAMLALDAGDSYAALGMGLVAVDARDWTAAVPWLSQAVQDPSTEVDARRGLARVHRAQGRVSEAIAELEQSVLLTLKGQAPISRPIATHLPSGRIPDPDHALVHASLAECHAACGDFARAIGGYQIAIVGGQNGPMMYARLAWWLLRSGMWSGSAVALARAIAAAVGWKARYADKSASIASRAAASMEKRLG